jgi:hypothetical protein
MTDLLTDMYSLHLPIPFCRYRRPSDVFYALFYLGLFAEARGETTKAEHYMRQAVAAPYAAGTMGRGDYMTTVARVRVECL